MMDPGLDKPTLLICHDIVGDSMAGPGIRYYQLARVLAKHVDTVLAVPEGSDTRQIAREVPCIHYRADNWETLRPHVERAKTCIFASEVAGWFPQLAQSDAYLVVDGYDPLLAEWLALYGDKNQDRPADWRDRLAKLHRQYEIGDLFLCASERQRDWWLGLLESNGRINPATYGADHSLRNLVDVVAYGLPGESPIHDHSVVKGIWDGIGAGDKVILWGGGLWSWLDPVTAIQAVALVYQERPDVRLVFPGTRHPNANVATLPSKLQDARSAAAETGLMDKAIFFGEWLPYADWQNLLLESDLALTLHFDTLETRLAYRSRLLEYIWSRLPIIATEGDTAADIVARNSLGTVVHYEDVEGVASAILELLDKGVPATNFDVCIQEMSWQRVAEPLIAFCRSPWRAADKDSEAYNPSLWAQLEQERSHWEGLVQAYESGRAMRAMKWFDRQKRRLFAPSDAASVQDENRS
ncbi:MAG: glycosyltransferase family 4 protein [Caldilineaceae bacterium]